MVHDKKTEAVKLHLSERAFHDLCMAAAQDDRKLSEFIGVILDRWLYGNRRQQELEESE